MEADLMSRFSDPSVLDYELDFQIADPRDNTEHGRRSGVAKEVFCLFFKEFISSSLIGFQEKVPCVRHDMTSLDWRTIARIILCSFQVSYYPLSLSPTFLMSVLFSEQVITEEMMFESFKQYVTIDERRTIEASIKEFPTKDEELESLTDLLSAYNCHSKPKADNLKQLIIELCHQELIQKPRYIGNCFTEEFQIGKLIPQEFKSITKLQSFYEARFPSSTRVIKSLSSAPKNDAEKNVSDHLTRFIKSG